MTTQSVPATSWVIADRVADFLGKHAIGVLLVLVAVILALALLLWRMAERGENALWRFAAAGWGRWQKSPPVQYLQTRWPRAWALFARRLSPEGYLGLHFTLAVCLASLFAVSFLSIADEVGEQEWLVHFDRALSLSLHQYSTLRSVDLFRVVTHFGDATSLALIGLGMAIWLMVSKQWRLLLIWIVALLGVGVINQLLKNFFQRVRPELPDPWVTEPGWSFPSGHAMGSLLVYGMLAYSFGLMVKNRVGRLALCVSVICLVLAIGFSRLYLGAHYFSDVVAGYVAAGCWLCVCISGNEVVRYHFRNLSEASSSCRGCKP